MLSEVDYVISKLHAELNAASPIRAGSVVHTVDAALDAFAAAAFAATPHSDDVAVTTSSIVDGRRYSVTISVRS